MYPLAILWPIFKIMFNTGRKNVIIEQIKLTILNRFYLVIEISF